MSPECHNIETRHEKRHFQNWNLIIRGALGRRGTMGVKKCAEIYFGKHVPKCPKMGTRTSTFCATYFWVVHYWPKICHLWRYFLIIAPKMKQEKKDPKIRDPVNEVNVARFLSYSIAIEMYRWCNSPWCTHESRGMYVRTSPKIDEHVYGWTIGMGTNRTRTLVPQNHTAVNAAKSILNPRQTWVTFLKVMLYLLHLCNPKTLDRIQVPHDLIPLWLRHKALPYSRVLVQEQQLDLRRRARHPLPNGTTVW